MGSISPFFVRSLSDRHASHISDQISPVGGRLHTAIERDFLAIIEEFV